MRRQLVKLKMAMSRKPIQNRASSGLRFALLAEGTYPQSTLGWPSILQ